MEAKPVMPGLDALGLFDGCVSLGRRPGECVATSGELLRIMDRYHIKEALVHDYHARSIVPIAHGNERLMKEIDGQERLHPVWVLD